MLTLGIKANSTHAFTLQCDGVIVAIDFTTPPAAGESRPRYWSTVDPTSIQDARMIPIQRSIEELIRLQGAGYKLEEIYRLGQLLDPSSIATWILQCTGWERPVLISTKSTSSGHRVTFDAPDAVRILRQPGFGHEVLARLRNGETPEQVNADIINP